MKRSLPSQSAKAPTAASSWLPKLEGYLLKLIFFLAPTQLGLHFWPDSAFVYGIRLDYLAPTLYFLDLLLILYLFLQKPRRPLILNSVLLILLVNLIISVNPLATLSWSLHLLLYVIFLTSIKLENLKIWDLGFPLFLSALLQLALAAVQFTLGRSLQGVFYYLGERMVTVGSPGVATANFLDQVVLRAYGTFSHPNVLAGWLVLVSLIVFYLKPRPILRFSLFVIVAVGLFLTQSRSAALAFFGLIIPFNLLKSFWLRLLYFVILVASVAANWSLAIPSRADLSFTERLNLQQLSLNIIRDYPLLGTGANASLTVYPTLDPNFRLLQPDHNSFTLFLSWFGLLGVSAIIYYFRICLKFRIWDLGFLIPLLPLLLLDHYLLTSPQGLFIFLLYLRLVFSPRHSR